MESLRVSAISAAMDRRVGIKRDTYTDLYSVRHANRAEVLEATVLLLIALEIVLSFRH